MDSRLFRLWFFYSAVSLIFDDQRFMELRSVDEGIRFGCRGPARSEDVRIYSLRIVEVYRRVESSSTLSRLAACPVRPIDLVLQVNRLVDVEARQSQGYAILQGLCSVCAEMVLQLRYVSCLRTGRSGKVSWSCTHLGHADEICHCILGCSKAYLVEISYWKRGERAVFR